jgi:hypothetical protein
MVDVCWGAAVGGVRFGLGVPSTRLEAGGAVCVELVCANGSRAPVQLFGFQPQYPRSLRVSPPKPHRPHIRVSFGDVSVLHPPDAFMTLAPGTTAATLLDLSFAFDRRGEGEWPMAFAYDPVRAGAGLTPWRPPEGVEAQTGVLQLHIGPARALRDAGVDEAEEASLDEALWADAADLVDRIRARGSGGAAFAARRLVRILSPGVESLVGWRALDVLAALGDAGLRAVRATREHMPHAEAVFAFADAWISHRLGHRPAPEDVQFVHMLDRLLDDPSARGDLTITWTAHDSPVHGMRRVQIFGDGQRIVTSRTPDMAASRAAADHLHGDALQQVLQALRFAAVWLLRPLRDTGAPDEPRPRLEVHLAQGAPFARSVEMLNGEWRMGPPNRLADLLDRLCTQAPRPA